MRMMKKLKSKAGESIGEVLAALLVSALGLVILAAMITSATKLVDQSKVALETYTRQENLLALKKAKEDDPGTVGVNTTAGSVTTSVKLTEDMIKTGETYSFGSIHFYAASLGGKTVTAYS